MSDLEFRPIHKFFRKTISSIKYIKNSNSDFISLHIYNNSPYQITLPLDFLGYCEINATTSSTNEYITLNRRIAEISNDVYLSTLSNNTKRI